VVADADGTRSRLSVRRPSIVRLVAAQRACESGRQDAGEMHGDGARILELRPVPDVVELHTVGLEHPLRDPRRHVRARDRVEHPPDEVPRDARRLERRDPALRVTLAVADVLNQTMADAVAVTPRDRLPLLPE